MSNYSGFGAAIDDVGGDGANLQSDYTNTLFTGRISFLPPNQQH